MKRKMETPIQRMIKVLEDIADKELNEDKRIAYGYCVYLANTYLEDEKDLIIGSYYFGWHDGHNYIDTMPKTGFEPKPLYEDGEDFYDKKFNTKEK